jgi:DNA-binding LytR/AlgR family response regulator
MHGPAPHEARNAALLPARRRKSLLRSLASAFAVGLFLAMIGPFGSIEAPLTMRLIYWVGLIVAGALIAEGFVPWLLHFLPPDLPWPVHWLLTSVLITVPMCVVVPIASKALMGWSFPLQGWMFLPFAFNVWVISAMMAGVGVFLSHHERMELERHNALIRAQAEAERASAAEAMAAESNTEPASALRERLSLRLQHAELYALEAEDHYVRAHTSGGSELILMRLADAVREAEGVDGLQTHRSWWIAKAGIAKINREGEKLVALLKSGVEAPISRSYGKAVRDAGWR